MEPVNSKPETTSQKRILLPALLILLVIVAAGAGTYYFLGRKNIQPIVQPSIALTTAIQPTPGQTATITILVPNDIAAYDKAMNECWGCANDPSKTWPFVKKILTVPYTTDVIKTSAEAAAEQEPGGQGKPPIIFYFKISGNNTYVLTYADLDGWAGVSLYLEKVHPFIEKTLLQFPQIQQVIFGPAPGDTLKQIQDAYSKSIQ